MEKKDEVLEQNLKIEQYIEALQKEPTNELLAATLTTIRKCMQNRGQFVVALEAMAGDQLPLQVITLENGEKWIPAFTSFDEELKGSNQVMSAFTADIKQLFEMAINSDEIKGILLNPWNRTLMLDKALISIIIG